MPKELLHVHSYIRRYHEYTSIWETKVDELYELKRESQKIWKTRMLWQLFAKHYGNIDLQDLNVARLLRNHILALMK